MIVRGYCPQRWKDSLESDFDFLNPVIETLCPYCAQMGLRNKLCLKHKPSQEELKSGVDLDEEIVKRYDMIALI